MTPSKRRHGATDGHEPVRRRKALPWTVVLCLLPWTILAQNAGESDTPAGSEQQKEKNFEILPAIVPTSSPELGLTLVGATVLSFRLDPGDTASLKTTIATFLSVSVRKAVVFGARIDSYSLRDRLRIEADLSFRNLPDHYWGLGFDRASTIPKSDSTTAYQRTAWLVKPVVLWRVKGNFFAGVNVDLNYTNARDPNPVMQEDPDFIRFGPRNFNSGAGIIARFDSRDIPVNAFRGVYIQALQATYGSFLGGDNSYRVFDLDYRHYLPIGRPGRTVAWTIRTRITTVSAPYAEVSQIGSSRDLRGYLRGRYRDRSMAFAIVEYRHMLRHFWSGATENKFGEPFSRHGFTLWAGIGTIGEDREGILRPLPNFGFGYRFEAIKRTNVRVDFGFSREGFGFYLDFAEAF